MENVKTNVHELFKWYGGKDEEWQKDWQLTNSMEVDGIHAQETHDNNGEYWCKFLHERKDVEIEVEVTPDNCNGNYDLEFKLDGKVFYVEAISYPFNYVE